MASKPFSRATILILTVTLLLAAHTSAQFSIPARYDGFSSSGPTSVRPIVLEAFLDLLCPSCKEGWPVLKEVVTFYGSKLQLIVHAFPVPFHPNAHVAARGMHIAAAINASLAYPWMEAVYAHQEEFSAARTYSETPASVLDRFAHVAREAGIDAEEFLKGFEGLKSEIAVRTSFKYGCSRAVVATPSFLLNGVYVIGADDSWTFNQWRALIDPLLNIYDDSLPFSTDTPELAAAK